jgi:hypothetical protein
MAIKKTAIAVAPSKEESQGPTETVVPHRKACTLCRDTAILAALAWFWLGLALPSLTKVSTGMFAGLALAGSWMLLALAWFIAPFIPPSLLRSRSARRWWLSAGFAGFLGLLLAFTDVGVMIRIGLCESSLKSYAAQVALAGGEFIHDSRPVGLFSVDGEEHIGGGVVFLYTGEHWIDRVGVAYVPPETTPPAQIPRRVIRHLYGPWYTCVWRF